MTPGGGGLPAEPATVGADAPPRPRVCVDLNVFVAAELAAQRGRTGGLPERVLDAIERREVTLVFSRNMAARLAARLEDVAGLPADEAEAVALAYAALADPPGLVTRQRPIVALGTGPHAEEDARVAEAALAGRADYLVTYNVEDFMPAAMPHPVTGAPSILGVQLVRPYDLGRALGWPMAHAPTQVPLQASPPGTQPAQAPAPQRLPPRRGGRKR